MTESELPDDADGAALKRLADDGVSLGESREVDFSIWLNDREEAYRVQQLLDGKGYRFRVYQVRMSGRWSIDCTRVVRLGYEAIVAAQNELNADLAPLGLVCDGWGTAH